MLARLGRFAATRHKLVVAIWVLALIALGVGAGFAKGQTNDVFRIPGTDSQAAFDTLKTKFPELNYPSATLVFIAPEGKTVQDEQAAIQAAIANAQKLPYVLNNTIADPFKPGSGALGISKDNRIAATSVLYNTTAADPKPVLGPNAFDDLNTALAPARANGGRTAIGGTIADLYDTGGGGISDHADELGLLVALIILIVSFGSVVAAGMPIGVALFGLASGLSLITIIERFTTIGSVAPILGTMIGLGVGIDYSLFVVSRYRQNRAGGQDITDAISSAVGTAGAAVLFAGCTVCIAVLGLAIAGIPYVTTLGWVSAIVVAIMVIAALTLLPALLGWVGVHIDKWTIPHLGGPADGDSPFWGRWARVVGRYPWVFGIVGVLVLGALTVPYTRMQLGFPDDSSAPPGTQQRLAFDTITSGFGAGSNGTLLVTFTFPTVTQQSAGTLIDSFKTVEENVDAAPGVAKAVIVPNSATAPDAAVMIVTPETSPDNPKTEALVRNLRSTVLPEAVKGTPLAGNAHVGGVTAILIDLSTRIQDRLPYFILAVVSLSFLLLMVVFRSILVPLQAAISNILSIGASYGMLVLVFQQGYGRGLIGLPETVPIVAFVPFMMFAILFGLSMDYEVFLMSRIKEEWDHTHDYRHAIAAGISMTARVITSAALIMIAVFLAFVTNAQPAVKMMGFGLAFAVLIDATVVRLLFVPATLELMGKAAWWFPDWLDRILPRLNIEGGSTPAPVPAAASTAEPDGVAPATAD